MKKWPFVLITATLLLTATAIGLTGCRKSGESPSTKEPDTPTVEPETTPEAKPATEPETTPATEPATEPETTPVTEPQTEPETELDLGISRESLHERMLPLFGPDAVSEIRHETVMFLEKGTEKSLMYGIDRLISVTSYDGETVYREGKDYELRDGKLFVTEHSSIPCITKEVYYGAGSDSLLMTRPEGSEKPVYTYWGEASSMTKWQICVDYIRSDAWEEYYPVCHPEDLNRFVKKLQNGEDVTVIFYGDSITYGSNASFIVGKKPYEHPYTMLFTEALADLFGYRVHYENPGLPEGVRLPAQDYVGGDRGTITYINPSVGGWTTGHGNQNFRDYVKPHIEAHGCDLFVVAFGMNDGGGSPRSTSRTVQQILNKVLDDAPDASLMIVSTMVPNPNATNGWYGQQVNQEPELLKLAERYRKAGTPCAVAPVTSVSQAVLKHKEFMDYTGNNINHPNDFMTRIYAQTLLQTAIGYENMK